MKLRYYFVSILVIAGLGYAFGRYVQPAKVEIKEVEIVKEVEVIKRDVKTIIREIERPDGTKEKETTIDDRTRETSKKDTLKDKETIITSNPHQYYIEGTAKLNDFAKPIYGVNAQRRMFGPIFGGLFINTDKEFGVSVGVEL